ncbi:HAMP domain-containing protein, partial [bacterium]|nr:HAMP domain-containing protein [bacterium]
MLKNIRIGTRLAYGFIITGVIIIAVTIFALTKMVTLSDVTEKMYNHPYTVKMALLEIEANLVRIHRTMKDVVLINDQSLLGTYTQKVDELERDIFRRLKTVRERYLGDMDQVDRVVQAIKDWKPVRDEVIALTLSGKIKEAAVITRGRGVDQISLIDEEMGAMKEFADLKAAQFLENAKSTAQSSIVWTIVMLLIGVFIGGVAALMITRSITGPLGVVTDLTRRIARGDLDIELPSANVQDELGMLMDSFRTMTGSLRVMADVADKVSSGDLTVNVQPQSDRDILGKSFAVMIGSLRETAHIAARISDGDLTVIVTPKSQKDQIGNAFAAMVANLREINSQIIEAVYVRGGSSSQSITGTGEGGARPAETATFINETTSTVGGGKQTSYISRQKKQNLAVYNENLSKDAF